MLLQPSKPGQYDGGASEEPTDVGRTCKPELSCGGAGLAHWQVVDGYGGRATDAGVLDKQGNQTPSYTALRRLLKQEWTTDWQGDITDGAATFRGFFGLYGVRIPGFRPARVWLRANDKNEAVLKLQRAAG